MSNPACRNRGRVRTRENKVTTTYSRQVVIFACYQQPNTEWTEWSYRTISERQAERLQAAGEVEPVYNYDGPRPGPGALERCLEAGTVQLVGYRATKAMRREGSSPCSLDWHTMDVAAMDPSAEMDWNETAQLDKFRLWPDTGDDRAVCVRPRPTAVERAYLKTLLASGRLRPLPKALPKAVAA